MDSIGQWGSDGLGFRTSEFLDGVGDSCLTTRSAVGGAIVRLVSLPRLPASSALFPGRQTVAGHLGVEGRVLQQRYVIRSSKK